MLSIDYKINILLGNLIYDKENLLLAEPEPTISIKKDYQCPKINLTVNNVQIHTFKDTGSLTGFVILKG